jgi:hypothetical protein
MGLIDNRWLRESWARIQHRGQMESSANQTTHSPQHRYIRGTDGLHPRYGARSVEHLEVVGGWAYSLARDSGAANDFGHFGQEIRRERRSRFRQVKRYVRLMDTIILGTCVVFGAGVLLIKLFA